MHKARFGLKLTMLLATVALLGLSAGIAYADLPTVPTYRPAKPVMHFVPQNVGIDDKFYCEFAEPECRYCHGSSTASRHHHTDYAKLGNCTFDQNPGTPSGCHEVIPGPDVEPIRDCKMCHIDNDPPSTHPYMAFWNEWGDLGYPHHFSDEADSGQCNQCHDNLVETYTGDIPSYDPSEVTPFPASCENCHFWDDPIPGNNPCNPDGPIHAPGLINLGCYWYCYTPIL
jgi:hypothetical protein